MFFGMVAMDLIANIRKELEGLKRNLEDSGVLKARTESESK